MEGLAFPLCLLRVSAGAYLAKTQPKAAAALHGLLEGVISVLLHKHVRHKGPTSGQAADRGGERNDAQQQQLSMPGSLPLSQVGTQPCAIACNSPLRKCLLLGLSTPVACCI